LEITVLLTLPPYNGLLLDNGFTVVVFVALSPRFQQLKTAGKYIL